MLESSVMHHPESLRLSQNAQHIMEYGHGF